MISLHSPKVFSPKQKLQFPGESLSKNLNAIPRLLYIMPGIPGRIELEEAEFSQFGESSISILCWNNKCVART
jgi:hypothetical protein